MNQKGFPMVDFFLDIYRQKAGPYHTMIMAEDFQQHLKQSLTALLPPQCSRLLDLGSGTGRLPRILKDEFDQIIALDLHRAMLLEQQREANLQIVEGDMRQLPIPSASFDVVSAGWAIGHLCGWYPQTWRQEVSRVLEEMRRTVRPGGTVMIMETYSTGAFEPAPPTAGLAQLYQWFAEEWGFNHQVISTDYLFPSPEIAREQMGFFFGEELSEKIERYQWRQVPEWTGIWWKTVD
jgi:ubiquinone/menaquinone biosynthesis C-methylase UbiE